MTLMFQNLQSTDKNKAVSHDNSALSDTGAERDTETDVNRRPFIVSKEKWLTAQRWWYLKLNIVSFHPPAENLDAMIAMQTKNKLGKSLMVPDISSFTGKL